MNSTNMDLSHSKKDDFLMESFSENFALEMVKVEGGAFQMGSEESEREKPVHEVTVPEFYITRYPVTNAQFVAFLNDYDSDLVKRGKYAGRKMIESSSKGIFRVEYNWEVADGYERRPAVLVNWHGATEFCKWLRGNTGKDYRLPSEAEWEFAARGGNKSEGFRYSGGSKLKEVGWYGLNSHGETKPVGLKLPNELGIFGMSGNIYEWCADHWHETYEGAPADGGTWTPGRNVALRVTRGGTFLHSAVNCRVYYRGWEYLDAMLGNVGFRVAMYSDKSLPI